MPSSWDFFTGSDPTHGLVNYQAIDDAISKKLAIVEGNSLILAVDNNTVLQYGGKRDSWVISTWFNVAADGTDIQRSNQL